MQFAAGWGDGAATSNSVRVERLSPHLVSHFAGAHVSRSSPSREDKKEEILMPTEKFQFEGEGGHQLAAALDLPDGSPTAYALFAHCFTCGKDVLAARRIAAALAAKGIAVLRFGFTGLGSSDGDFANATFSSNVADLVRAADHLRETHKAPAILIGHSLCRGALLRAGG